jgi:DNA-binding response OmpR family regulator
MKKILIADDHPGVRELLRATFEGASYLILIAENGEQALALARTELPDIVLLDIQMPGSLDGLQVCRLLKSETQTQGIYVMMVTAKGQVWDKQASYEAGADDYLVKPFSPLELMVKVEAVLATNPAGDVFPAQW